MDDQPTSAAIPDPDLDRPSGAPAAPPSAAAEYVTTPTNDSEVKVLSGAGGEKKIMPADPSLSGAVTNISPLVAAANNETPAVSPSVIGATVVEQGIITPDSSPAEQPWQPDREPSFSSPGFVLAISLVTLLLAIIFMTVGSGINIWAKGIIMLILSGASLFMAMRAYDNKQDKYVLLSFIISAILLVGTFVISSTGIYYYFQYKNIENSFNANNFD